MSLPKKSRGVVRMNEGTNPEGGIAPSRAWWQPQNWSTGGCRANCNWAASACTAACAVATAGVGLAGCVAACGLAHSQCIGQC